MINSTATANTQDAFLAFHVVTHLVMANANGVLCILFNSLNLVTLRRETSCFGEATTVFVKCLALTDLLTGVCIILAADLTMWKQLVTHFSFFCSLTFWSTSFITLLSFHFISCLTFDRVVAIAFPLRHRALLPPERARKISFCAFINVLAISVFISFDKFGISNHYFDVQGHKCISEGFYKFSAMTWSYYIYASIVGLFIPFSFTVGANIYLFIVTVKHAAQINVAVPENVLPRDKRPVKISVVVPQNAVQLQHAAGENAEHASQCNVSPENALPPTLSIGARNPAFAVSVEATETRTPKSDGTTHNRKKTFVRELRVVRTFLIITHSSGIT
ncbi:5-hydroxytryptamine receptor 4 [Holothuria leucospilota]|uniref:5-hydroxytryptamine receptor 4 n=1 Tax=Holothuria leucospilota TaxID=206669 RepID=A0A9Q1CIM0_HOLLE|nr:5-hydroxytryptamine receptor 4 [Holothuria leucospilota]